MNKLLSNRFNDGSVPKDYIFPPEIRPGNLKIPFSNIPVIDLGETQNGDTTNTIHKIIKAAEEFGFFQVQTITLLLVLLIFFTQTMKFAAHGSSSICYLELSYIGDIVTLYLKVYFIKTYVILFVN